ncbi:jun dimerization protein 2 isoform X2 [Heterocephalus glaber]|uniref:Jun dimerization protein 2 isoform X2 n=1 Tax=Heterocephalus glaber TaxID=10181 RepID=A0AAX6RZD1_HETGA|nr:jun dimerization protein 2 isoform X2 [Heterocephalus glaber]
MQPVPPPATACGRDARRPLQRRQGWRRSGSRAGTGLGTGRQLYGASTAPAAGPGSRARRLCAQLLHGWLVVPPAMMPGQIPDPSVTAGSLPGLGPLTGLPSSALTAEELKYADIRNIGAMIAPLHFLEVKLGKRPQPVKSEIRVSQRSCHFWFHSKTGQGAERCSGAVVLTRHLSGSLWG